MNQNIDYLRNIVNNKMVSHAIIFKASPNTNVDEPLLFLVNSLNNSNYEKLDKSLISNNILLLDDVKEDLVKNNLVEVLEKLFKTTLVANKPNIFIIKEIENASNAFNNSLLKSIEEAPENSYIFIVTYNYHKILSTIKSRCQSITILPLSFKEKMLYLESLNFKSRYPEIYAELFDNYEQIKQNFNDKTEEIINKTLTAFLNSYENFYKLVHFLHLEISKTKYELTLNILKIFYKVLTQSFDLKMGKKNSDVLAKMREKNIPYIKVNLAIDDFLFKIKKYRNFFITKEILISQIVNIYKEQI
ncbi:hypothetical protein CJJ23_02705 [Mycoplasmopsis agassizii]|uniref:DNA polymerase III subunit delta n=1 Tax=Mycoplasmopsis agassizii TaxID=33922 RepID=A0A269TIL5_9BACT|nr:hypothetical protein [Mycoplasmopsis agassizii]PAK21323.1 hypothetical protein CJJ23_02705 [Mycoplasmopsis agassizii]